MLWRRNVRPAITVITLRRVRCGRLDSGCPELIKVLENAPGSLGGARSLSGEQFDPPRECIDHYQDVGVALVIDWKRTNVVYV